MTDSKTDLFPPRTRYLTRAEADACKIVYERLIAEYEAKRTLDGTPRHMSEIYTYEIFWARAYGAKAIVVTDDPPPF